MEEGLCITRKILIHFCPKAAERRAAVGLTFVAVVILMVTAAALMAQTGGGATLVGTVTDNTGAVIPAAKVKVVNTGTSFVSETTTTTEGTYYVPYLTPGSYRITVEASGFKQFVRDGIALRSAEVPRIDITLEVGSQTESVTVVASAPLLDTETAVSAYVIPQSALPSVPGIMKRAVYLLQYMPGVVGIVGQGGYHIAGQSQNSEGWTIDGITSKSPYLGTVNQVDGVLQPSLDAVEEAKVLVTGNSAIYGHMSGGQVNLIYKSGTNTLHGSFEERYLNGKWAQRDYLTQNKVTAPWSYTVRDVVGSGPLVIPGIYNGRNKTFWLSDYVQNHENTIIVVQDTVPTPDMLNGIFSFPDAPGGGLPIYNPFSTRQVGTTWTRDPFPNNTIPKSMFDPVAVSWLALGAWRAPSQVGSPSRTGPTQNELYNTNRLLHRDRWDEKVDHQFSPSHKIFGRYSQNHHRGSIGSSLARPDLAGVDHINPVDQINGVLNDTYVFSPTMFNEFRIGFMRRANSTPDRFGAGENWAQKLGMPNVPAGSFPFFDVGYGIGALNQTREVGQDMVLEDIMTRNIGRHSVKVGYEMIRTTYSLTSASLPSGQYEFGGTELPFTPNTGQTFASFLLGTVTSATFTQALATFMPIQWSHDVYVQDDWKVAPNLSLNLGLRWTYSSPFKTKWGQQSQFDPNVVDPVTGLMGAITHPTGAIGRRDLNNFQPRLGLAWKFHQKWVFRSSFDVMTSDNAGAGGFDEYSGTYNILQPTGDPNQVFQLKNGPPGTIQYKVLANGTVPYTGASYGSRTATYRDPNLRNPYVMMWSGGFQHQISSTWVMTLMYRGSAGVGLTRSWNINTIPLSIALGGNTALQDKVYQSQQNYLLYPQFGTINMLSNFNHSTWHSGNIALEKRYSSGITLNPTYDFSKCLGNANELSYYERDGKGRCAWDYRNQFGVMVSWELPVGHGKRWLNQSGIVNEVLGGWTLATSENGVTGEPLSVTLAGSPYKYLTPTNFVNALAPIDQAKVPNWTIGNRYPNSTENPYFNMNVFAYPASYTVGSLGAYVLQAPGIYWNQVYASKSWTYKERAKVTLRVDGHNLPWKRPNVAAPNTTYNLNNVAAWGKFTGTVGDHSNFGSSMSNIQGSIRVEFN